MARPKGSGVIPLEQRLKTKLVRINDCLIWTGSTDRKGYGQISVPTDRGNGWRLEQAHRVAFRLWVGDIPDDLWVLHNCHQPPCCEPYHLYLGDQSENELDKIEEGYQPHLHFNKPLEN